ncbi:hypothetical protein ONS96_003706, partial [Cadophora gregata f. sp. sojae]
SYNNGVSLACSCEVSKRPSESSNNTSQNDDQLHRKSSIPTESSSEALPSLSTSLSEFPVQRTYSIMRFEATTDTAHIGCQDTSSSDSVQTKTTKIKLIIEDFDAVFDDV